MGGSRVDGGSGGQSGTASGGGGGVCGPGGNEVIRRSRVKNGGDKPRRERTRMDSL